MPTLRTVLFRPITRDEDAYTIEAYDGNITLRAEKFKKMSAAQVQAALFFFSNLGKELLRILPSCLTERSQEIAEQLKTEILPKNGGGSD